MNHRTNCTVQERCLAGLLPLLAVVLFVTPTTHARYRDGMNLYLYVGGRAGSDSDPSGRAGRASSRRTPSDAERGYDLPDPGEMPAAPEIRFYPNGPFKVGPPGVVQRNRGTSREEEVETKYVEWRSMAVRSAVEVVDREFSSEVEVQCYCKCAVAKAADGVHLPSGKSRARLRVRGQVRITFQYRWEVTNTESYSRPAGSDGHWEGHGIFSRIATGRTDFNAILWVGYPQSDGHRTFKGEDDATRTAPNSWNDAPIRIETVTPCAENEGVIMHQSDASLEGDEHPITKWTGETFVSPMPIRTPIRFSEYYTIRRRTMFEEDRLSAWRARPVGIRVVQHIARSLATTALGWVADTYPKDHPSARADLWDQKKGPKRE